MGDAVPHVKMVDGRDVWFIRSETAGGPGWTTMAGFDGSFPESPSGYDAIPKSSYDARARLAHMDAEKIYAQVLYPNVGGFGAGGFLKLREPELMLECVRAYNDFLIDWCSADQKRLLPVAAMPFWDVKACVAEVQRAAKTGHRAILFCSKPTDFNEPPVCSKHWDPIWAAAQDVGLSISFHIGAGDISDLVKDAGQIGTRANFGRISSQVFMMNAGCISDLIFGGVCHRFPKLDFVSVESGVGWLPSFLEGCDWQWTNGQVRREHPEYDLLPSEYFERQIYGSFWFEEQCMDAVLERYPNNILWETDFPHPTCQHPGPANARAQHPASYAEKALAKVAPAVVEKILFSNAARIYRVN
jgi:predicted TIM-barrel fold metal-dependent hydrolase